MMYLAIDPGQRRWPREHAVTLLSRNQSWTPPTASMSEMANTASAASPSDSLAQPCARITGPTTRSDGPGTTN